MCEGTGRVCWAWGLNHGLSGSKTHGPNHHITSSLVLNACPVSVFPHSVCSLIFLSSSVQPREGSHFIEREKFLLLSPNKRNLTQPPSLSPLTFMPSPLQSERHQRDPRGDPAMPNVARRGEAISAHRGLPRSSPFYWAWPIES